MRGMGAAALLCHSAFAHARAAGVRVVPTCSYISQVRLAAAARRASGSLGASSLRGWAARRVGR